MSSESPTPSSRGPGPLAPAEIVALAAQLQAALAGQADDLPLLLLEQLGGDLARMSARCRAALADRRRRAADDRGAGRLFK